jgi:serine/threonine protein kinase
MANQNPLELNSVADRICSAHDFEMVGLVGGGAFKDVYQVRNGSGADIALKIVRDPIGSLRTQREIDAILRCNHPNIAKIFGRDRYSVDGQEFEFLLEEFVPGGTLSDRLGAGPAFELAEILEFGRKMVGAIAHLAELDLVHRDIKPDNIIYRQNGRDPVLVDFGLVRDLGKSSLTPTYVPGGPGTPYFASPEQLNNDKDLIDWRTDQFGLGVVLSVMTVARHPFEVEGRQAVENVIERRGPTAEVADELMRAGLPCVPRMVDVWPVGRYRDPESLMAAWDLQVRGE